LQGITIQSKISEGQFGEVYKGTWLGTPVALKRLKNTQDIAEFEHEYLTVRQLRHPHIVQFLGLYAEDTQRYIVLEYMALGSVHKLVKQYQNELEHGDLLAIARQAAAGMAYLEGVRIVHRDLALRNLLASGRGDEDRFLVKVSDFGLSRAVSGSDLYEARGGTVLSVRWASPELLRAGYTPVFTHKSDVWAFGVLLWELFSWSARPYGESNNKEVYNRVAQGELLSMPIKCPSEIYAIMQLCWKQHPGDRSNFSEIFQKLQKLQSEPWAMPSYQSAPGLKSSFGNSLHLSQSGAMEPRYEDYTSPPSLYANSSDGSIPAPSMRPAEWQDTLYFNTKNSYTAPPLPTYIAPPTPHAAGGYTAPPVEEQNYISK